MGRQYQWRWHCPRCGRPYAKRTLLMRHHKSCTDPYSPRWERVEVGYNHVWKPVSPVVSIEATCGCRDAMARGDQVDLATHKRHLFPDNLD